MTAKQVSEALTNCEDGETFEVVLKNGDRLNCRANPKRTRVEVAEQSVGTRETYYRGDIIKPREIADF